MSCAAAATANLRIMSTTRDFAAADLAALAPDIAGLVGDIRSDHAGETGAVLIYRGILAASRDPAVRAFATEHMATEQRHLDLLEAMLPPRQRSVLLPVWRVAGFLTGFLPALVGSRAVYATIDAVETFVDHHYEEQIRKLPTTGPGGMLRSTLMQCQADEVHHRDEARSLATTPAGHLLHGWAWMVGAGSKAAVSAARRI
jgi:ubiquinone biosynthesis monooxygenase Coq7